MIDIDNSLMAMIMPMMMILISGKHSELPRGDG